jgi:tRNA-specific 2-thiouridylase
MKNNKTVLVSLSGGIKSLVAAYILKKQGDQVTGAFISIPSLDGDSYSLRSSCHQNDEDIVRKYCDLLEIPFLKIDGADYFQQFVVDRLIAAKLSGEAFIPCVYCNQIRMSLLIEKADDLKINYVATGHLAQKLQSAKSNSYYLSQAQDQDHDQSSFLAGLDNAQLERLRFPLGKLAMAEINKIGKSLLGKKVEGTSKKICLTNEEFLPSYIESNTPESLRSRGNLIEYFDDLPLGEHDGIYNYKLGQSSIRCLFNEVNPDYKIVAMDPDKKEIKVAKKWNFESRLLLVRNLNTFVELDLSKPIKCEIVIDPLLNKKYSGILFFNNNEKGSFELEENILGPIQKGQYLAFYLGNKILGSAQVESTYRDAIPQTDTFKL